MERSYDHRRKRQRGHAQSNWTSNQTNGILNRLNAGRRKHACVKATINGRTGVVVSGGINGKDRNMTSVEFYDTASGAW